MPNPIITDFARVQPLGVNGAIEFQVDGDFFDAATRFTIVDVRNPGVVWSPSTQAGHVTDNGTRALIATTPSMPGGGPLPASGDLRISACATATITPQLSFFTKTFLYQGVLELSQASVH